MNGFTLLLNTATNLFAVPAIYSCYKKQAWTGVTVISTSMIVSSLMHISETKHGLKPFILKKYSGLFLNMDRTTTLMTFMYGLWLIRKVSLADLYIPFLMLTTGTVALRLGELTSNLYLYNILHTIWHGMAFGALYYVS